MKRRRRVEITVEQRTVLRVRRPAAGDCGICRRRGVMVTPEESAAIRSVPLPTVFRWIQAGLVHFAQSGQGQSLVCLASLPSARDEFDPTTGVLRSSNKGGKT